jgi:hypothetical protein
MSRSATAVHLKIEHLTWLAFGDDFEGPAADFAISREPLRANARIDA